MKRVGRLFERAVSYENLYGAVHDAARGKRSRPDVAAFLLDLEREVPRLRRALIEASYRPGGYRTFTVREPKQRVISAAAFRDRVVHHALTRVLEPVFERRFTADSFACRRGFGTHRALDRAKRACRTYPFVLKLDIRKYFAAIDHEILMGLLARVVKCKPTLRLASVIIEGSNPQEATDWFFPGDDLFAPSGRRRGLPLGNQTSQFFANVDLNPLDHHVRRVLRPGEYIRYVDDFLLFDRDKDRLREMKAAIVLFLQNLRLLIHGGKSRVYRSSEGVTFLGFRLFPGQTAVGSRQRRAMSAAAATPPARVCARRTGGGRSRPAGEGVGCPRRSRRHGALAPAHIRKVYLHTERRRNAVCCAAGRGTTIRGTFGSRTATGTTTTGSVVPGRRSGAFSAPGEGRDDHGRSGRAILRVRGGGPDAQRASNSVALLRPGGRPLRRSPAGAHF